MKAVHDSVNPIPVASLETAPQSFLFHHEHGSEASQTRFFDSPPQASVAYPCHPLHRDRGCQGRGR